MIGKGKLFLVFSAFLMIAAWGILAGSQAVAQIAEEDRALNLTILNSDASEIAPIVSADGTKLYFTSDRRGAQLGQDFWVSTRVGGEWGEPELIAELSTDQNEGPDSISIDGSTMYFTACNRKKDLSDKCDIYSTRKKSDGSWGEPKSLGDKINTNWEEANASISPDGNTIFFASNRPGGEGGYDIWISKKDSGGKWGEPVNAGRNINTPMWEGIAFAHPDGSSLFFSSNGRGGFGNADIFQTPINADGTFGEPKNLGGLVNTEYNDIYFSFPGSGDYAYFSSSAELPGAMGREDIYAIPIPMILSSPKFIVIRGTVFDLDNNVNLAAALRINGSKSQHPVTITTNQKTGRFSIPLQLGESYTFIANSDGYFDNTTTVDLTSADPFRHIIHNIAMKKLPEVASTETIDIEEAGPDEITDIFFKGGKVVVKNIEFDFDKYYIKDEFKPVLSKLALFMKDNPSVVIRIEGYTDSVGPDGYNMKLSWKRARSVKNFLSSQRISRTRLITKGHGETNLIAVDDPEYGNQQNRRCEFSLVRGTFREPDVSSAEYMAMSGKSLPPGIDEEQRYGGVFKDYEAEEEADRAEAEQKREQLTTIEIMDGAIALAIRNDAPYYPGSVFLAPIPKLYCFTPVVGVKKEAKISHVWYLDKKRVYTKTLVVKSEYFKTWSSKSIPKGFIGKGHVDVIAEDGHRLARFKFEVRAPK